MNKEFLRDINPGTVVAVHQSGAGRNQYSEHVIGKVTKTLIVLTNTMRFNRATGRGTGETGRQNHFYSELMEMTDEVREQIRRQNIHNRLSNQLYNLSRRDINTLTDEEKKELSESLHEWAKKVSRRIGINLLLPPRASL